MLCNLWKSPISADAIKQENKFISTYNKFNKIAHSNLFQHSKQNKIMDLMFETNALKDNELWKITS